MSNLNRRIRTYALLVLAAYGLTALLIGADYVVLYRTGELAKISEIVTDQQRRGGLYLGLAAGIAAYKYEGYQQRHPDIVAIGTSRAMQIRDYFFTQPFYNLGGLAQGQMQAFALMDRLLLRQPPKTVIFAVDFWTFCTTKEEFPPFTRPNSTFHDGLGTPDKALLIWRLFAEGTLSTEDLVRIFRGTLRPPRRVMPRTGVSTLFSDDGFGPDGSLYTLVAAGNPGPFPVADRRSDQDIDAIRCGGGRIPANCHLSEENLALIGMLGSELKRHGIRLIVIAPPVTSALFDAIRAIPAADAFMTSWRRRIEQAWPEAYDFTDPKDIGASDCEFYDGIHGGEVAYARIFRTLAARDKNVASLLNLENLDRVIAIGKDRITVALGLTEKARQVELGGFTTCHPSHP